MKVLGSLVYTLFCVCTAIIGYSIHGNFFYAVLNFFFAPLSWIVWLIGHDINWSGIKAAFNWFFT